MHKKGKKVVILLIHWHKDADNKLILKFNILNLKCYHVVVV